MSYILDALRKADAERRGVPAVTGMTEPAVLVAVDGDPDADLPPQQARPWIWVLAGIGLALIAALVWNLWRTAPARAPAPDPVAVAPTVPAVPVTPTPATTLPVPATPAAEADALPRFPPALPDPPKPEPKPETRPAATALPTLPPVRGAPPPGIAVVTPAAPPRAAAADRTLTVAELPEAVRRDLPRLSFNGAMYSERAADRMVVINGQVFHEGDTIGRDLTLKQIRLKSAVVEFRGQRVEMGY